MQDYTPLGSTATTTVKDGILNHEKNINALRSTYSGTAFPTENLVAGMKCYRTDLGKTYTYNGKTWDDSVATASLTVSGETSVPTPAATNNSKTIANTEFVHGVVSNLVNGGITANNFQTGTGAANYFQSRKFRGEGDSTSYYHAIDFGYSGHDSVDFYEYDPNWNFYKCITGDKSNAVLVGNINGNGWNGGARLTGAPTAPTAAVGTNTTQIATTAFVQAAIPTNVSSFSNDAGYIKSVNNTKPDASGNVTITVSGGGSGGVSTSTQNTWTAQQSFTLALLTVEKYKTAYANGNSVKPSSVTAVYNATGSFTLDLTNFSYLLSAGQSLVFTAYIKANADYPLTITNGGTLKYIGSPSDLAITSAGLLLNIFITLDNSGNKTSIVQASKLA